MLYMVMQKLKLGDILKFSGQYIQTGQSRNVQDSTVLYCTVLYVTFQYSTVQYRQYSEVLYVTGSSCFNVLSCRLKNVTKFQFLHNHVKHMYVR